MLLDARYLMMNSLDNFSFKKAKAYVATQVDRGAVKKSDLVKFCLANTHNVLPKDIRAAMADVLRVLALKKLKSKADLWAFVKLFETELAFHPSDVEAYLSITRTERKRWQDEGLLRVVRTETARVPGNRVEVPYFSCTQLLTLPAKTVSGWRKAHAAKVASNRKLAAKKSVVVRQKNKDVHSHHQAAVADKVDSWKMLAGVNEGLILEFSFVLLWLNRWAKVYEEKYRSANKLASQYAKSRDRLYLLKASSLARLISSPFCSVSFYRPDDADKIKFSLCHTHLEEFRDERSMGMFDSAWEYYGCHEKRVNKCPGCKVSRQSNYYSLFCYNIAVPGVEDSFSFHLPYPIARDFMGSPGSYSPAVNHGQEGWGGFRFGRALYEDEQVLYKEKDLLARHEQLFRLLFPVQ